MVFFCLCLTDTGNIRINHHGVIGVVNNETGFCAVWFFHMFFLDVINFHFFRISVTARLSGQ